MRIRLETISVWDAVKKGGECFLCAMRDEAEQAAVKFYLGPSVMNPETRVRVNASWFCPHHARMLLSANKAQATALLDETRLSAMREVLEGPMKALLDARSGRRTDKAVSAYRAAWEKLAPRCLVCSAVADKDERDVISVAYLWGKDPDFRNALAKGKGFCLDHYLKLLELSKEVLGAEERQAFVRALTETEEAALDRLGREVAWQADKYKAENFDKPWNGCEDAHKRCTAKIQHSGRKLK